MYANIPFSLRKYPRLQHTQEISLVPKDTASLTPEMLLQVNLPYKIKTNLTKV